jgi:quercetin dioxygenase-like cupin family protein
MENLLFRWHEIEADRPIPLLHRQMVMGEKLLAAMVRLEKGCKVVLHHHDSEQFAYVISGRVKWGLGALDSPDRREFEMTGGEILRLPSNLPHEVEALEETMILDMLSPPGPMGVDSHQ